MRPATGRHCRLTICAATVLAAGCSLDGLSLPPLPEALGGREATAITTLAPETSIEIYARVARGALKCWFGPEGSLKATHTFHARVDPPSKGGAAEIAVQTRDPANPSHGSLRAYDVTITPTPGGSLVQARNVRFTETEGGQMTSDVGRWLKDSADCSVVGTGGWVAQPGAATPAKDAAATRTKAQGKQPR